jgi:hypothetical protein
MTTKRFLIPVLALTAFGLPASAGVASYCDTGNCTANASAFETAVAASYVYASLNNDTFTNSLSDGGLQYIDTADATGIMFAASSAFSLSGITLVETAGNTITITIPAAYAALRLSLSQTTGGNDLTYLDSNENYYATLTGTPQEVGFINNSPGSVWYVTLIPAFGTEKIQIDGFDPAGTQAASTPEVGTLLLIGAGLIAMRWLKRRSQEPRKARRLFRNPLPV